MRKIAAFISLFLLSSMLFSQARTNAELAKITDTGKELNDTRGWSKNKAGQWSSRKNLIIGHDILLYSIHSFDKLKLYSIVYKNKEYILFEIVVKDWGYEYPTIREGRFDFRKSHFYIIEKEHFVWRIKENEVYKNQIPIISYFENSDRLQKSFRYIPIYFLPELITPSIEKPKFREYTIMNFSYEKYIEKTLDIFMFYYKDDNVVRFYFSNGSTETMPEDFYFECPYEHFANFFNPVIEEHSNNSSNPATALSAIDNFITMNFQEPAPSTSNDNVTIIPDINWDEYLPIHRISEPPRFNEKDIVADLIHPAIAKGVLIEGKVILELFIDENGVIQRMQIIQEIPQHSGFGEAAIKAFEGKNATPAVLNGKNVKCRYRYPVSFRLK